jgi:phosphoglycerol transferase MdoB-like AlkP superfamily enzyme
VINSSEPISSILKDEKSILISNMLRDSYQPWRETECLDVFTYYQAMHYLNTKKPKAMFISFGETDEWAHDGAYNHYLDAAHKVDTWIKEIWNWAQATPGYKDNTYILITTDHGRGFVDKWTSHGAKVPGASSIWFALLGPDVKKIGPLGEQTKDQQLFQKQLAATITKLIGQPFKAEHPIGDPIY